MRDQRVIEQSAKPLVSEQIRTERLEITNLIALICGYLCFWLPFALVSLVIYFGVARENMSPLVMLYSGLIAKLSFIWIATFYLFTSKKSQTSENLN